MRKPASVVAALLLAAANLSGQSSKFDKTIAFPRPGPTDLNFTLETCTIREVEIKNYPSREDIEDARKKDPDDHSLLLWRFHVDNRGARECKVRVWVDILDKDGHVVQSGDRSGNVDAGKVDDDITIPMRMRTLDAADAHKVRIRGEIIPK
jgi:hypothetical protein